MTRLIALDHLTLLDVRPPEFIEIADSCGFNAVGLRVIAASAAQESYPMSVGSRECRATKARLDHLGVRVLDIESLSLSGTTDVEACRPALELGAELGAAFISCTAADPAAGRIADRFAELVQLSQEFGITALIEPMAFRGIDSIASAKALIAHAGGGALLIDSFHFNRCSEDLDELAAISPDLIGYVQVADGPRVPDGANADSTFFAAAHRDADARLLEANYSREIPGAGELPLVEFLGAVDANTPLAVEVPARSVRDSLGDVAFAQATRRGLARLLTADSQEAKPSDELQASPAHD